MLRTKWLGLYLTAAFIIYVLAIFFTIKYKLLNLATFNYEDFYPMNDADVNADLVHSKQQDLWSEY